MKHVDGESCPSCEEKLNNVDYYLQSWFRSLKTRTPDIHISWGWRGEADQNTMLKAGLSHDAFPNSPHNAMDNGKPCSRAIDLFQQIDGKAVFDAELMKQINSFNEYSGLHLVWGGNFKTQKHDDDHFELAGYLSPNTNPGGTP